MPSVITIHPAGQPDHTQPKPYHIGKGGLVGRQDYWKGDPYQLAGFQQDIDINEVNLDLDEFLADPTAAIGMFPVFIEAKGDMYTLKTPIARVTGA